MTAARALAILLVAAGSAAWWAQRSLAAPPLDLADWSLGLLLLSWLGFLVLTRGSGWDLLAAGLVVALVALAERGIVDVSAYLQRGFDASLPWLLLLLLVAASLSSRRRVWLGASGLLLVLLLAAWLLYLGHSTLAILGLSGVAALALLLSLFDGRRPDRDADRGQDGAEEPLPQDGSSGEPLPSTAADEPLPIPGPGDEPLPLGARIGQWLATPWFHRYPWLPVAAFAGMALLVVAGLVVVVRSAPTATRLAAVLPVTLLQWAAILLVLDVLAARRRGAPRLTAPSLGELLGGFDDDGETRKPP